MAKGELDMAPPVLWSMKNHICDAYESKICHSTDLHGHKHFLLTLITRGSGTQTLNGNDVTFRKNDLFFLSPADFHKNTVPAGESFDYFGVKFSYELMGERLSDLCVIERFPIHVHLSDQTAKVIRNIFTLLVEETKNGQKRPASKAYQQALVEQLVILAFREMPTQTSTQTGTFINRTLGYVHSHFHESITVADAAAYAGYSTNYFNTRFRERMGLPFGEYLQQLRLTFAKNMLISSHLSVTEIALESGFSSLSHFSHCFQVKFGQSPQAFRKTSNQKTR